MLNTHKIYGEIASREIMEDGFDYDRFHIIHHNYPTGYIYFVEKKPDKEWREIR